MLIDPLFYSKISSILLIIKFVYKSKYIASNNLMVNESQID
jgi:hypothetical protein